MKTWVYVADRDNPSNTEGIRVGWVKYDDREKEVFVIAHLGKQEVLVGHLYSPDDTDPGEFILAWEISEDQEPVRLVSEPFPVPEPEAPPTPAE